MEETLRDVINSGPARYRGIQGMPLCINFITLSFPPLNGPEARLSFYVAGIPPSLVFVEKQPTDDTLQHVASVLFTSMIRSNNIFAQVPNLDPNIPRDIASSLDVKSYNHTNAQNPGYIGIRLGKYSPRSEAIKQALSYAARHKFQFTFLGTTLCFTIHKRAPKERDGNWKTDNNIQYLTCKANAEVLQNLRSTRLFTLALRVSKPVSPYHLQSIADAICDTAAVTATFPEGPAVPFLAVRVKQTITNAQTTLDSLLPKIGSAFDLHNTHIALQNTTIYPTPARSSAAQQSTINYPRTEIIYPSQDGN